MKRNTASIHEVKVYLCLAGEPGTWFTNKQIAERVGFSERTVRAHTLKLDRAGIVDCMPVYPKYRYQIAPKVRKQNELHVQRLVGAAKAFGLVLPNASPVYS